MIKRHRTEERTPDEREGNDQAASQLLPYSEAIKAARQLGGGHGIRYYFPRENDAPQVSGRGAVQSAHRQMQLRPMRSFREDRDAQMKRWIATVIHAWLKRETDGKHVEVQVASNDNGDFVVSTNTKLGNRRLRERWGEVLKHLSSPPDILFEGSNVNELREIRHHLKLSIRTEGKPILSRLSVIEESIERDQMENTHAEVRLIDAGFRDPHGVRRPCASCLGRLIQRGMGLGRVAGYLWPSRAANPDNRCVSCGGDRVNSDAKWGSVGEMGVRIGLGRRTRMIGAPHEVAGRGSRTESPCSAALGIRRTESASGATTGRS